LKEQQLACYYYTTGFFLRALLSSQNINILLKYDWAFISHGYIGGFCVTSMISDDDALVVCDVIGLVVALKWDVVSSTTSALNITLKIDEAPIVRAAEKHEERTLVLRTGGAGRRREEKTVKYACLGSLQLLRRTKDCCIQHALHQEKGNGKLCVAQQPEP
jgi:hypothetical protein